MKKFLSIQVIVTKLYKMLERYSDRPSKDLENKIVSLKKQIEKTYAIKSTKEYWETRYIEKAINKAKTKERV